MILYGEIVQGLTWFEEKDGAIEDDATKEEKSSSK